MQPLQRCAAQQVINRTGHNTSTHVARGLIHVPATLKPYKRPQLLPSAQRPRQQPAPKRQNNPRPGPARAAASEDAVPSQQDPQVQIISNEPLSDLDVDRELWEVLDMCSDEELEAVYNILYGSSPFSPVLKSIMTENEPALLDQRGRRSVQHKVETRFRFLAADSATLLKGGRPSYRQTLLNIRDKLEVHCSGNLSTYDLETEVFLHILTNSVEYVRGEHDPDPTAAAAIATMNDTSVTSSSASAPKRPNWTERLTAPFKFGVKDIMPTLLKFGSVLTVTKVGQRSAQDLAAQLVCSHLRYQAAAKAATAVATKGAMAAWSKQAMLEAAQRSLTAATARYSAVRGVLSFLGPLMWGWLALDLALKAIGTDYARVVRAVFMLAQVRLVRTQGFVSPEMEIKHKQQNDDDDFMDPGAAFV